MLKRKREAMLMELRAYKKFESRDLRHVASEVQDGIENQLMIMQTPFGYRRVAELFRPQGEGLFPAILYLHWYEPASDDSNRSQFVEEAKEMARSGAVCLLIETFWSDPDFFYQAHAGR